MAAEVVDVLLRARADFSAISGNLSTLKKEFQSLSLPKDITNNLEKGFDKLNPLIKDYQKQLSKGFKTKADLKNFNAISNQIETELQNIINAVQKVDGQEIHLKADDKQIVNLEKKLDGLRNKLQNTLNNITLTKSKEVSGGLEQLIKVTEKAGSIKPMAVNAKNLFDVKDFEKYNAEIDKIQAKILSLSNKSGAKIDLARALGFKGSTTKGTAEEIQAQISKAEAAINNFFNTLKISAKGENGINSLITTKQKIADVTTELEKMQSEVGVRGGQAFQGLLKNLIEIGQQAHQTDSDLRDSATGAIRLNEELSQLKTSTQYFFSLRNMINLFKRGVREAVETVKDLDAAMTETAVVTKNTVGDMWKMLPIYTTNAKALGATVQDMYEATTLYYQQGLNSEQAMDIATQTMKMARIGGLEAAEATDMMTAALRGFNMELNETSAQRINDVYSNLAAKTASNTEELGTAMQRTASIAASAGMSFEGTAAFLAQAIETTREPAENLGTAMKTIVARFTELKKNPLEIAEVDGEEVSYNKVDTALQSIGVSLKDTNGQFRELDQVFLDISQRWNGLTQTQQRYIATIAAGSRQQSRFIAMMSNYDRTVELMKYANDSAGASTEQFGKTMDSLEAKANRFKDTWQEFLMNIANETAIKGFIDGGTKALNILNKIIEAISKIGAPFGLEGFNKSILSLAVAFLGLKTAGRGINGLIGGFGGMLDPNMGFKQGFIQSFSNTRRDLQAAAISNPIVNAINGLIPVIQGAKLDNNAYKFQTPGDYNQAKSRLDQLGLNIVGTSNKYTPKQILNILEETKLNPSQQKKFFQTEPGLKRNLTRSYAKLLKDVGESPENTKALVQGFTSGSLPLDEALKRGNLGKTFGQAYEDIKTKYQTNNPYALGGEARKELEALKQRAGVQHAKELIGNSNLINQDLLDKFLNGEQQLSTTQKLAKGLGETGAAMAGLGMAAQMAGSIISKMNPELGELISNFGTLSMTIGMVASALPALSMLTGPQKIIAGIIAAVGAGATLSQHHSKKIQKAAEEVTNTYKEQNEQLEDNLGTLKQYQSQVKIWSKGVDINGNNVSLSDEEYNQYLEAVDKIAEINPSIVQGYNAQGHAILDINKALKDTIRLETQRQQKNIDNYIEEASLQKLINARNINDDYREATKSIVIGQTEGKHWQQGEGDTFTFSSTPMLGAVQQVLSELQNQKGLDINKILSGYNITLEQLQKGEAKAVQTFIKNQDQINAQVGTAIAHSKEKINDSLIQSFDDLSTQTSKLDEAIAPVVQNLQTYIANTPSFKNVASEFQTALTDGLKEIAIQPDLKADEMQNEARLLIQEFDNLSAEGSRYSNAMKEVEEAQNKFAESLDASKYTKNTEGALRTLDSLMSQYAGKADVYSQAIAEYLQNQMDQIRDFTTDSGVSLSQAMNGVTDTIAAAEGAYDSFQESTKTDLATGKDSMKSIFDEITKETDGVALHMEKFGDGTMWKGARALLGDKFVEENSDNVDKIKKAIKSLEPELEAGEAGFKAFWHNFKEVDDSEISGFTWNEDGSYDIDRNVNPDVYEQIANAMHRSEEYVVAMLNAGKQFASIDFHNVDDVRKALSTDEAAIKNNGKIFVKSDYYDNALDEAHIYNPNERKSIKEQDKAAGVIEIKDPDKITKKDFQSMGISDLPNLIKIFGDTGQYNRDEIAKYAEALGKSGLIDYNPEDFDAGYQHYLDTQEHPELQPIQSIESTVQQIAGLIDRNNVLEGHYSKEDEDNTQATYEAIVGGKGDDTPVQFFGQGKNEFGNRLLTPQEFTETYANLGKIAADAEEKAVAYYQGAKVAETRGDIETAEKLTELGDKQSVIKKVAQANQEEGIKNWLDKYAREAYDNKIKELSGSGLNDATIKQEASKAWQKAFDNGQEIIKAAEEGSLEGLQKNDKSTKKVEKTAKENFEPKDNVPKTSQNNGNKDTTSKHETEFTETGADEVDKKIIDTDAKANEGAKHETEFTETGSDEVNKKLANMEKKASKGSTYVTTFKTSGDETVNKRLSNMEKKGGGQVEVGANTDAVGEGVKQATTLITNTVANLNLGVEDHATSQANAIKGAINGMSATIDVYMHQAGNWTAYIGATGPGANQGGYTGLNNKISYHHVPMAGSLAGGTKKGRIGPRNQGGLTLTGERGYEIAWLPSQNKSAILGANGPQMVDLPKDATVYNHEQSKEIMKKRGIISAGSLDKGSYDEEDDNGGGDGGTKKKKKKKNKKGKGKGSKTTKATKAIQKVNWWWDKTAQRLDVVSKKTERYNKTLERKLADLRASINSVNKANTNYIDSLKKQNKYYKQEEKRASIALGKQKATTKKEKSNRKLDRELIVSLKKSKGKAKDKSISATKYISYDKATGAYYADYSKIKKGIKGKQNQKTVYDAVEGWVKDYTGKYNDAKDAQLDNLGKIADIRKEIDNTFFGWKNELNEIYKITGKIEQLEAKINKEKSSYDYNQFLLDQQDLARGMTKDASDYLKQMKQATITSKDYYEQQIKEKEGLIEDSGAIRKAQSLYGKLTNKSVTYETKDGGTKTEKESKIYNRIKGLKDAKRGSGESWDELSDQEKQIYARGRAFSSKYIPGEAGSYSFDNIKIEQDRASGKISKELYELIKDTYDTLHQYDLDLVTAEGEIIGLKTSEFEAQKQYEDTVKQISEELYGWKNTLTKILELTTKIEQSEKRTSILKAADEYYSAKRQAGYGADSNDILYAFTGQVVSIVDSIEKTSELIDKQKTDLQDYISGADLEKEITRLKGLEQNDVVLKAIEDRQEELDTRQLAQQFVHFVTNADGTVTATYDENEIRASGINDKKANEIIAFAEEAVNQSNKISDNILTNINNVKDLYAALKDLQQSYADEAKKIREAYTAQKQKEIDRLKTLYNSIDNNFKELISSVRQTIQSRRQTEDNAKTEDEISRKQQRLAMLRADTSGGNQAEIAQLEKELADAQQGYGRTLEDQMLEKVSQQGDMAAKQRERQIELMQGQRDLAIALGEDAKYTNQLLEGLTSKDATIAEESRAEIEDLLTGENGWTSLTTAEQTALKNNFNDEIEAIKNTPDKIATLQTGIDALSGEEKGLPHVEQTISETASTTLQNSSDTIKNAFKDGLREYYSETDQDAANEVSELIKNINDITDITNYGIQGDKASKARAAYEGLTDKQKTLVEGYDKLTNTESAVQTITFDANKANAVIGLINGINDIIDITNFGIEGDYTNAARAAYDNLSDQQKKYVTNYQKLTNSESMVGQAQAAWQQAEDDRINAELATAAVAAAQQAAEYAKYVALTQPIGLLAGGTDNAGGNGGSGGTSGNGGKKKKKKKKKYKTGGLANFTGPAWLDGTPSKPELVLNAKDTQNFLALRDVLSKAIGSTNSVTNSYGGDATYEININVDHLNNDYDVDKVVEKVKKEIVKGSGYRNVTQVRNFR